MTRVMRIQILDEEQKAQVGSILSQFDPASLTAADVCSIIDAIKETGIEPGEGVFEVIKRAGYDPSGTKLIIPLIIACKSD